MDVRRTAAGAELGDVCPHTAGLETLVKAVALPMPRLSGSRQAIAGALVGRGWANLFDAAAEVGEELAIWRAVDKLAFAVQVENQDWSGFVDAYPVASSDRATEVVGVDLGGVDWFPMLGAWWGDGHGGSCVKISVSQSLAKCKHMETI